MLTTAGISLSYGKRSLFKDVSITFTPGNCYGLIGANGAGKSTFLKILSGEIKADSGHVSKASGARIATLAQDHFQFDDFTVLETVIMGHKRLNKVMREKDALYAKPDFSEADGIKASELETEFAEMNGWNAEAEAGTLLGNLGIPEPRQGIKMRDLEAGEKIRVLLAQSLFGNPEILLMDEPTNHLDIDTIKWLEDFLYNFQNTVIVVSHDRHFLDQVCTHVCDIDFGKISTYTGNYSFWYESSQLALQQKRDSNKKKEDKMKDLQTFIQRFSANASKSRQATSRKKLLDKITLEDIKPSNRQYPYILFKQERESGKVILVVENLTKTLEGKTLFRNVHLNVNPGDKIAFIGRDDLISSAFFQTVMGEMKPDSGSVEWGVSISKAYFPKDNSKYFESDLNLVDWLRQYSKDQEESYVRGFLGKMLFSGEEALKKCNVLSGGEKVRCMLSKLMLQGANVLVLDEPTNHLDLESIMALNNGLRDFDGTVLFTSQDRQFIQTIANRIVEITPKGVIDRLTTLDDYLENEGIRKLREGLYGSSKIASVK